MLPVAIWVPKKLGAQSPEMSKPSICNGLSRVSVTRKLPGPNVTG